MKRYGNMIPQIIDATNMGNAFDEVVGGLKPKRKEHYEKRRSSILKVLTERIRDGTFHVENYEEFWVQDGPKKRLIQSPTVVDRIGCNAIMRVVEKYVYPTTINTSAASIKGRGMHKLFRKVRSDIGHDFEGTKYYYKCDIKKFYQSIDQKQMKKVVRRYIKDKQLLPILDSFINLMPSGLSIGLRSSQ